MAGFVSLRQAQAQKNRIKDERNAETRALAEALAKYTEAGLDPEKDIGSMYRIAERQRSAYRFALQELRRLAVEASPAASVIPIAVLGAHESPTMIVAAGVCECVPFAISAACQPDLFFLLFFFFFFLLL